jgi:predicted small metal-binding protein
MNRVVRCACGIEIRGDTDQDLVRLTQEHARLAHDLTLSAEQVLAMAEIDQEGDEPSRERRR